MNPGWRVEWWTDNRLPEIVNRKAFEGADKMAAKSDILRYELVWRYGGISGARKRCLEAVFDADKLDT